MFAIKRLILISTLILIFWGLDSSQAKDTASVKRHGVKPVNDGYTPKEGVDLDVQYENGKLLVFARGKTVKEVFAEIAKRAKIEIIVDEETGKEKTSLMIKDKSLKEGIESILNLIGLRNLAISYKEVSRGDSVNRPDSSNVGAGFKPAQDTGTITQSPKTYDTSSATPALADKQYGISKVEIRKRSKEEMEKVEADEEKSRQEEYQKKEKWYHNLFKDMGKKGKLEGMLKDYADGKNRIDVETYLRQATFKPEDKQLLREALRDPKYSEISGAITLGLTHAIIDKPEESDKEFILEALEERKAQFMIFTLKFIWDERFIPVLIRDVKELHFATAAEILGVRKVKEAVPALEEALVNCTDCKVFIQL